MERNIPSSESKQLWPRILNPTSLSFKTDGEIEVFKDKHKLRLFMTTKTALQIIPNWIFYREEKEGLFHVTMKVYILCTQWENKLDLGQKPAMSNTEKILKPNTREKQEISIIQ